MSRPYTRAEELEACPDFIAEAIAEEIDTRALAEAVTTGNAQGLLEEVRQAMDKHRAYLMDKHAETFTSDSACLDWLIVVYGPAWGAGP